MGPRPPLEEGPREAEAAGEGSDGRKSAAVRGAKTRGVVSGFFMPKKSWKIGLAGNCGCGSVEFLQT